jgi:hypothetical protein
MTRPDTRQGRVRRRAARLTERTDRLLDDATGRRPPPLAPIGAVLLGLALPWQLFAVISLYPMDLLTPPRVDLALATVLGLAAVRIWTARAVTPITVSIALAVGLVLLALGLFFSDVTAVTGVRLVTGGLGVTGGLICLLSPWRRTAA